MLNCEVARMSLKEMTDEVSGVESLYHYNKNLTLLNKFINSVEELLKNNSIKQTPALFKPYEKGD